MTPTITLTVVNGPLEGTEFVFQEPCKQIIGRANDCTIQLPTNFMHAGVSRHHCLLVIDPPTVSVQDLGSLNGTFINGEELGEKVGHEVSNGDSTLPPLRHPLKGGDELQVGDVVFRVGVAGGEESLAPIYLPPSFR